MRARAPFSWLLLCGALLAAACQARAERAGAFPHIEPWPSSLALGGLADGLGGGVEAVLLNPTGMLHEPTRGLAVSHASLFEGNLVNHQAAAFCWVRYEEKADWAGGRFRSSPDQASSSLGIGFTNLSGDLPDTNTYGEIEISVAYARKMLQGVQAGARVRVLQARSTVDASGGGGMALDLGLSGRLAGFRVGGVARSLVSAINWDRSLDDPLPRAYDVAIERPAPAGIVLVAGASLYGDWQPRRAGVGARFSATSLPISFSAGSAWRDLDADPQADLSAGVGIRVRSFRFDYGLRTSPEELGEIHRFGLQIRFP